MRWAWQAGFLITNTDVDIGTDKHPLEVKISIYLIRGHNYRLELIDVL